MTCYLEMLYRRHDVHGWLVVDYPKLNSRKCPLIMIMQTSKVIGLSNLGVSLGAVASSDTGPEIMPDYANIGVTAFKINRLPSVLVTYKEYQRCDY